MTNRSKALILDFLYKRLFNESLPYLLNTRLDLEDPKITIAYSILAIHGKFVEPQHENGPRLLSSDLQILSKLGIKITTTGILIGNQHPSIIALFKNTIWDKLAWQKAIRAYPGVKSGGHARFASVGKMRTIFVPIAHVWQIHQLYLENVGKASARG